MREACIAVLDVGKTHAKLSLWNRDGSLLERRSRANLPRDTGLYVALDTAGIEEWIAAILREFATLGDLSAIIPVGHGAAAAIIRDARLVCPPMDYEQNLPTDVRARYLRRRDPFESTGSPSLPQCLNLGAQLFWLEELVPGVLANDALILPWPQYWAWVLSGVAASEATSLGCHTDLWRPLEGAPSSFAVDRGWAKHLAPLRCANRVLGTLRQEWVARTGLSSDTRVFCGLHDSNAALLAARGFPFFAGQDLTVVSTGTWFLVMRSPTSCATAPYSALAEGRDCLINVDADGKPVPSARLMGGREIELLTGAGERLDCAADQARLVAAAIRVVQSGARILPTLAAGVGPYPRARHRWEGEPSDLAERRAAIGLYAALVTDTSLDLVGARDHILIEGRFAEEQVFVRALASLRNDATVYVSDMHDGVSYGALRLVDPTLSVPASLRRIEPLPVSVTAYKSAWRTEANRLEYAA